MIEVYIDGASAGNPGPSGAGIFIKNNGQVERYSIPLGIMSNHEAEFHAFIEALKICQQNNYKIISIRTDSQLIDRAVEKNFMKNEKYSELFQEATRLMELFDFCFVKWISSAQNKTADELARKAVNLNH